MKLEISNKFVCCNQLKFVLSSYLLPYYLSEEDEGLDSEWIRNTVSLGGGENGKVKFILR